MGLSRLYNTTNIVNNKNIVFKDISELEDNDFKLEIDDFINVQKNYTPNSNCLRDEIKFYKLEVIDDLSKFIEENSKNFVIEIEHQSYFNAKYKKKCNFKSSKLYSEKTVRVINTEKFWTLSDTSKYYYVYLPFYNLHTNQSYGIYYTNQYGVSNVSHICTTETFLKYTESDLKEIGDEEFESLINAPSPGIFSLIFNNYTTHSIKEKFNKNKLDKITFKKLFHRSISDCNTLDLKTTYARLQML